MQSKVFCARLHRLPCVALISTTDRGYCPRYPPRVHSWFVVSSVVAVQESIYCASILLKQRPMMSSPSMRVTRPCILACTLLLLAVGIAAQRPFPSSEQAFSNHTEATWTQRGPHSLACFTAASQCPKDAASTGASSVGRFPEQVGTLQEPGNDGPILAYVHHHKSLLPLDWSDIVGFLAVIAALLLAASSGVGGGGLLIPIYLLIFGKSYYS
jgi:hypothetical protein